MALPRFPEIIGIDKRSQPTGIVDGRVRDRAASGRPTERKLHPNEKLIYRMTCSMLDRTMWEALEKFWADNLTINPWVLSLDGEERVWAFTHRPLWTSDGLRRNYTFTIEEAW
jgi:hypothetical protein